MLCTVLGSMTCWIQREDEVFIQDKTWSRGGDIRQSLLYLELYYPSPAPLFRLNSLALTTRAPRSHGAEPGPQPPILARIVLFHRETLQSSTLLVPSCRDILLVALR